MLNKLAVVLPLTKQHTLPGRQIILVDIENVVGGAVLTRDAATWARKQIEKTVSINRDAHVVIGTSHIGLLEAGLAWPNKQYVARSGPDGADLALLGEIEHLRVDRYDQVVLASGDGIFADAVGAVASRGANVTVVAHHGQCAKRLRLAAHTTLYLQAAYNHGSTTGTA